MALNFQTVKDHLQGMIHGGSVNKIRNINELAHRASMNVISRVDLDEARRIVNIPNAIHDDIFDYSLPSDFNKIIDLRNPLDRKIQDNTIRIPSKEFDLRKELTTGRLSIKDTDGTKTIRINVDIAPAPITLNDLTNLTNNGTWGAVGDAINLEASSVPFKNGAVEFDIVTTGDGIENSTMTAQDLTEHDERSQFFARVNIPDASKVTSITLLWGNDLTTNFWTGVAQTAQFDGTAFRDGFNIIRWDWDTATETGTVDLALIDSLRITFASTAQANVSVDKIFSSIGEIWEIEYYSKFLWRTSIGVFIQKPSADSDLLNLDEAGFMLFLNELAILSAQQLFGRDAINDIRFFNEELHGAGKKKGLYRKYKQAHPSKSLKLIQTYYRLPPPTR